jgi:nucleoside-diphosphate-sugar epimerase
MTTSTAAAARDGSVRMTLERFLVTGALGCIGSWAVKRLVDEGVPVTTYDLPGDPYRMRLIMDDKAIDRVNFVQGDITDEARFEEVVRDNGITHIIHLAALQVPFVRANPVLGARVNMVGTAIVFETARKLADQIAGLAYASSVAVYGSADLYPPGPLADDAPLIPVTLYGVTKEANEGWAAIYWQDYGVPSVGLRPFFVYGPGRDQGVSSTPTKAMAAAAVGRAYHISFGGTDTYQHASLSTRHARCRRERRSTTWGEPSRPCTTSSLPSSARRRRAPAPLPTIPSLSLPRTESKARRLKHCWDRSPGGR